jgi:hypothetical protein
MEPMLCLERSEYYQVVVTNLTLTHFCSFPTSRYPQCEFAVSLNYGAEAVEDWYKLFDNGNPAGALLLNYRIIPSEDFNLCDTKAFQYKVCLANLMSILFN